MPEASPNGFIDKSKFKDIKKLNENYRKELALAVMNAAESLGCNNDHSLRIYDVIRDRREYSIEIDYKLVKRLWESNHLVPNLSKSEEWKGNENGFILVYEDTNRSTLAVREFFLETPNVDNPNPYNILCVGSADHLHWLIERIHINELIPSSQVQLSSE